MILLLFVGCAETAKVAEVAVAPPTRPALEVSQEGLDLVLQGGGAKGLAHIGAIREIELQERPFRRIVGTSAGSIVAVLLAAGFSAAEMQSAITERTPDGNIIMGSFLTPPEASEFTDEILRDRITFLTF